MVDAVVAERQLEGLPTQRQAEQEDINDPSEVRGVKITRLGRRSYDANAIIENVDPRGRTYYWIGGNRDFGADVEGTDFSAVRAGYVSVTPVHLDLTNYGALDALAAWEARLSPPGGR